MTEAHPDVIIAARQLLQWGRSRQSAWHDASQDLLAALGNRYASFEQPLQEWMPIGAPPPLSARPHDAEPVLPVVPPPPVAPPVVVPSAVALPPPIVVAPPPDVRPTSPPKVREQTPVVVAARSTRRRLHYLAVAAAVILASAAVPVLWRAQDAGKVVAPTTNTLTIESTPPGAVVLFDGVESGKTPLTMTAAIGAHKVELRYRKKVRTLDVDVTAGSPVVARVDWTKSTAPQKRSPNKRATSKTGGPASPVRSNEPTVTSSGDGAPAPSAAARPADDQPGDPEDSSASGSQELLDAAPSAEAPERP